MTSHTTEPPPKPRRRGRALAAATATAAVAIALAGAVVAVTAAATVTAAPAGAGGPSNCSNASPGFHKPCIELPVQRPGAPGGAGGPTGGTPGSGSGTGTGTGSGGAAPASPYECRWVDYRDQGALAGLYPDAPPGSVLQEWVCWYEGRQVYGPYVTRAATPGEAVGAAPAPPTPEVTAELLLARAEGLLTDPQVAASPAVGTPSVVNVPTFVSVANWQDAVRVQDCVLGVCVELTATPSLSFDPGEPGADVVACDPPGTRYDPDGAPAADQAAAERACAHAYRARTGVTGRPDAWPGVVTVTWDIAWTSNIGPPGTFDPVVLATDVPRAVDEVRALVVDAHPGGR